MLQKEIVEQQAEVDPQAAAAERKDKDAREKSAKEVAKAKDAEQKAKESQDKAQSAAEVEAAKKQEEATKAKIKEALQKEKEAEKKEAEQEEKSKQERQAKADARAKEDKEKAEQLQKIEEASQKQKKKVASEEAKVKLLKKQAVAQQKEQDSKKAALRAQEVEQSRETELKAEKQELHTKGQELKEMQRKAAAQEREVEQAKDRLERSRGEVTEKATQKAFQREVFRKASRAELKKKKAMQRRKEITHKKQLDQQEQANEASRDARHQLEKTLTAKQKAEMFALEQHEKHDCPKASTELFNDTSWAPPTGCECVEHPWCHLHALLEGSKAHGGSTIWCHTTPSASCKMEWAWCTHTELQLSDQPAKSAHQQIWQSTQVAKEMSKVEKSLEQAKYTEEKQQLEVQRRAVTEQKAVAKLALSDADTAMHRCAGANGAPNVSVAVFNDKMWSPSEGCECLEHPFCSRKALLVRGVSQKWPQRSQVTFGNGQLNAGRTDASEHYSTGGYMWCFTRKSKKCTQCWSWCHREVLAIPQVDLANRTEVKREIRKIETSQEQYHQEEKQMEAQRNKQLVVAQAADEVTADAIHQCTAADAAPNVSVAVFNDKMWSPSEGCECLEHPFCSRKALLVRGVSQKWPQRSQVTFGNGQLNAGRTDASEHYSTGVLQCIILHNCACVEAWLPGGYMWCFTKRSATCGKCWNWCQKEDLAATAIALTAKKIDSGQVIAILMCNFSLDIHVRLLHTLKLVRQCCCWCCCCCCYAILCESEAVQFSHYLTLE